MSGVVGSITSIFPFGGGDRSARQYAASTVQRRSWFGGGGRSGDRRQQREDADGGGGQRSWFGGGRSEREPRSTVSGRSWFGGGRSGGGSERQSEPTSSGRSWFGGGSDRGQRRSWFGGGRTYDDATMNSTYNDVNTVTRPTTYNSNINNSPTTNNNTINSMTSPVTYNNNANTVTSPVTYNNNANTVTSPVTYNNNANTVTSPVTNNSKTPKNSIKNAPTTSGRNTTSERELLKLNKRIDLLKRETDKLLAPRPGSSSAMPPDTTPSGRNTTSERELQKLNKRMDLLKRETDKLLTSTAATKGSRNTTSERELQKLNKRMDLLKRETDKLLAPRPGSSSAMPPDTTPRGRNTTSERELLKLNKRMDLLRREVDKLGRDPKTAPPPQQPRPSLDRFRGAARTATAFRPKTVASPPPNRFRRLQAKRSEYFASTESDLMHLKNLLFQVLFNMPKLTSEQKEEYVRNVKGLIEPHLKELGADIQAFRDFDYVTESENQRFLDIKQDAVTGALSLVKFKVGADILKNLSEVMLPL
jgi:hypothetical protein